MLKSRKHLSPQQALQLAEQAVQQLETLQLEQPDYPPIRSHLLTAHYQRASALVALDRLPQAVQALRAASALGQGNANRLREDPRFEPLQDRRDFEELLSELSTSSAH